MLPSIFGENLLDDFWEFPTAKELDKLDRKLYGKRAAQVMKTDVHEDEGGYEVDIDLPGFKKDEIKLTLEDGYLSVSAAKGVDKEKKDRKGRLIRQERYSGAMQRSFYACVTPVACVSIILSSDWMFAEISVTDEAVRFTLSPCVTI